MLFIYCFVWSNIQNFVNGEGHAFSVDHSSSEIFIWVKKSHYERIPDVMQWFDFTCTRKQQHVLSSLNICPSQSLLRIRKYVILC